MDDYSFYVLWVLLYWFGASRVHAVVANGRPSFFGVGGGKRSYLIDKNDAAVMQAWAKDQKVGLVSRIHLMIRFRYPNFHRL